MNNYLACTFIQGEGVVQSHPSLFVFYIFGTISATRHSCNVPCGTYPTRHVTPSTMWQVGQLRKVMANSIDGPVSHMDVGCGPH